MKRLKKIVIAFILLITNIFIFFVAEFKTEETYKFKFIMNSDKPLEMQLFYSDDNFFVEEQSAKINYIGNKENQVLEFAFQKMVNYIRLDFGNEKSNATIKEMYFEFHNKKIPVDLNEMNSTYILEKNMIASSKMIDEGVIFSTSGNDSYIVVKLPISDIEKATSEIIERELYAKRIIAMLICNIILFFVVLIYNKLDYKNELP